MDCPRCKLPLEQVKIGSVLSFSCSCCHGQAITLEALRTIGVMPENITAIWQSAISGKSGVQLHCPECGNGMKVIKLDNGSNIFHIDICTVCHLIWFDFKELEQLPIAAIPKNFVAQLPQKTQDALAMHKISRVEYGDDSPPTFLDNLGIDRTWCFMAIRLLIRLFLKI